MRISSRKPGRTASIRTAARRFTIASFLTASAVTAAAAPALAAGAPPPPKGWEAGWQLSGSAWLGRYNLASSKVVNPQVKQTKTTGQMTLFLQTAYAGKPPVPAGIIALRTPEGNVVLYLTALDHDGSTLVALVHGGAFVAPASGKFILSSLSHGTVRATLSEKGMATTKVTFKRFSKNAKP